MEKILMVDDDEDFCRLLEGQLSKDSYRISRADAASCCETVRKEAPACILLDLKLKGGDGFEVLEKLQREDRHLPVIILTGVASTQVAVDAIKKGAFQYVVKSPEMKELAEELEVFIEKAIEARRLYDQVERMKERLVESEDLERFFGSSEKIRKVIKLIRAVAATDVNVLVSGESGTGKEVVAKMIHRLSARKEGPFIPIDCAAIPETLIESELFGHEKGSFTGATETRKGKIEVADRGTVFLDEVANIPLGVQAKLLRFLETHECERIGSRQPISPSVRVIAASNIDLSRTSQGGGFRADLFYRLNEFPIHLPPLRKRRDDIPFLCLHLLRELKDEVGRDIGEISTEALEKLKLHEFPGNVRELRNILKTAMVVAERRIEVGDLVHDDWSAEDLNVGHSATPLPEASRQRTAQVEKQMIIDTLKKTEGHQGKASNILGITPRTLYNKMKAYGINR